ncbi:MAG: nuclear transport factor 2 family protein [Dehalococcoidia bacterium]|nr:nuclear transport factor 2 family protein [Dehalococcoidia bacterium]
MLSENADILSLRDANQRFYDAFGSLDMAQMDAVWEQSDRALCVHPGWQPIVGWGDIRRSWQGIFNGAALMHFNIHYVNIAVEGNCGFVTCVESITSVVEGQAQGFGVLATNIFVRSGPDSDPRWLCIAHHASPRL